MKNYDFNIPDKKELENYTAQSLKKNLTELRKNFRLTHCCLNCLFYKKISYSKGRCIFPYYDLTMLKKIILKFPQVIPVTVCDNYTINNKFYKSIVYKSLPPNSKLKL